MRDPDRGAPPPPEPPSRRGGEDRDPRRADERCPRPDADPDAPDDARSAPGMRRGGGRGLIWLGCVLLLFLAQAP